MKTFVSLAAILTAVANFGNCNVTLRLVSPILSSEVERVVSQ